MQKHISFDEIARMEQLYRSTFVNSLSGFKSICLIGTKSKSGKSNLAIFNSLIHIGANPPYIGFVSRPNSEERHTVSNILDTGYYTINHIHQDIYEKAHQTSARYNADESEFKETGLKEEYLNNFYAPFVNESKIKLGVKFKEAIPIKVNNTTLIIGEITDVFFPNNCFCDDGFLDIEKAGTITGSGLDSYHTTRRLNRLSYAKPLKLTESIPLNYIQNLSNE